jgi:hypothetical protein
VTASEAEVGVLEVDAGDAPTFSVVVDPFAVDTTMTATITDPSAVSTSFTMTPSVDHSTWTGTAAALSVPGEYTAKFTIVGTGAGVKYATVIVASPPPLSTEIRRVRLLIADTDPASRLFRADQITDFLDLENGHVKLAAAQALDAIAVSEVLVSKVVKTQDLQTDGAKVAAELRARASELRRQVLDGEGDDSLGFEIVDFIDPFTRRHYWPGTC